MREHIIYRYDQDPVTVYGQLGEDGIGVLYTVTEDDGRVSYRVPWAQITKIVSRRVPDDVAVAVVDVVAEAPEGYDPDDETADSDDEQGTGDSGDSAGGVTAAGTANSWPEADNATMRSWAQTQGLAVSASGPVSNDVKTAYAAAHAS